MSMGQYLAVATAAVVFVAVLYAFYSFAALRDREAARRQAQADLRSRGA